MGPAQPPPLAPDAPAPAAVAAAAAALAAASSSLHPPPQHPASSSFSSTSSSSSHPSASSVASPSSDHADPLHLTHSVPSSASRSLASHSRASSTLSSSSSSYDDNTTTTTTIITKLNDHDSTQINDADTGPKTLSASHSAAETTTASSPSSELNTIHNLDGSVLVVSDFDSLPGATASDVPLPQLQHLKLVPAASSSVSSSSPAPAAAASLHPASIRQRPHQTLRKKKHSFGLPSLSSGSKRKSFIPWVSSSASPSVGTAEDNNTSATPASPTRPESNLRKLSFGDRLCWVLDQTLAPSRPHKIVYSADSSRRVLVQAPVVESEDLGANDKGAYFEKTLEWGDVNPDDPTTLSLVTAPGKSDVTEPLNLVRSEDARDDGEEEGYLKPSSRPVSYVGSAYEGSVRHRDSSRRHSYISHFSQSQEDVSSLHSSQKMDFARSLTRRVKRSVEGHHRHQQQAQQQSQARQPKEPKGRPRISLPMNIISSTNMAYLSGPNVEHLEDVQQRGFPSGTASSFDERSPASVRTSTEKSIASAEPALTDASSVDSTSPIERHHPLSEYLERTLPPTRDYSSQKPLPNEPYVREDYQQEIIPEAEDVSVPAGPPPAIPRRAPSHSKREHVRLARVRSIRSSNASTLAAKMQSVGYELPTDFPQPGEQPPTPPPANLHPFSSELEQLDEAAEEFGGVFRQVETAEDSRVMSQRGLARFRVDDYMTEISSPWAH